MDSTDLVAQVRFNAMIEDTSVDYSASVLLRELTHSLTQKFQSMIVDSRCGYWMQYDDYSLTSGVPHVRMPARSVALSKVTVGTGSGDDIEFVRLPQTQEGHADIFEVSRSSLGQPSYWVARGSRIVVIPTPDNSGYTLRVWYYLRPSSLVAAQNGLNSTTDRGRITAVDTSARTITVNAIPFDQSLSTPAAMTSGSQLIDVVQPSGWHELTLVGATQTWSGTTITVGGSKDMRDISVGDYVRVSEQTEWPAIPDDFHRALADITTVKVLIQRDHHAKATDFASDVNGDLGRFDQLIGNRVREEPRVVRAPLPSLRRARLTR